MSFLRDPGFPPIGSYDVFALVINIFQSDWQLKHVTIGLFKETITIKQALAQNLTKLLEKYALRKEIIAYVKNEGLNFNAMTNALKYVVSCECLGLEESFQGGCFGHAFSKACQCGSTNEKRCKNFKYVSIKSAKSSL